MSKKIFLAVICGMLIALLAGCESEKVNVVTGDVTGISDNDAVVHGYIDGYDEMPEYVGVSFGNDKENLKKIIRDSAPAGRLRSPDITVDYDVTVDGGETLEPSTTYYYQFYVKMKDRLVKGDIKSFETVAEIPEAEVTISAYDVKNLTDSDARMKFNISGYDEKPTEVGLYFGESPEELKKVARSKKPMNQYDKTDFDIWYTISLDTNLTLKPSTTYYYQCYVKIGDTETRGEVLSFTTEAAAQE